MVHINRALAEKVREFFSSTQADSLRQEEEIFLHQTAFSVRGDMKFRFKPSLAVPSWVVRKLKRLMKKSPVAATFQLKNFFSYYGVKYFRVNSDVQRRFTK
ncbi:hypothetical protein M8J76_000099 [Diaphorina citri]|nr:hypothetical protein M8J76_000099 [Diaphorina citri]